MASITVLRDGVYRQNIRYLQNNVIPIEIKHEGVPPIKLLREQLQDHPYNELFIGWIEKIGVIFPKNPKLGFELLCTVQHHCQLNPETIALQRFVSNLWSCFSSRVQLTPNSSCPIITWGEGPKAYPRLATIDRALNPLISLPHSFQTRGILGWITVAHEVGHCILEGNGSGLVDEISSKVSANLQKKGCIAEVTQYFASRVSEAGADIVAVLLMGPAGAIGLYSFLRAARGKYLSCVPAGNQSEKDPHPVDVLRASSVAHALNVLYPTTEVDSYQEIGMKLGPTSEGGEFISNDMLEDLSSGGMVYITTSSGQPMTLTNHQYESSIKIVTETILFSKLNSLNKQSLKDTYCWSEVDTEIVKNLSSKVLDTRKDERHIVAAALFKSLEFTSKGRGQEISPHFRVAYIPDDMEMQSLNSVSIKFKEMIQELYGLYQ